MKALEKDAIKKYVPEGLLSFYHYLLAVGGALLYGFPSRKMIVIGVTGTSGKSTTITILAHLLDHAGFRSGFVGTTGFKIGSDFRLNDRKMTMLGRFQTQRILRKMFHAGCTHVIVETTSQGIVQHRHRGIHYDTLLFTNLYPEHIEAHGSFENYKNAKLELFRYLMRWKPKTLHGVRLPRTIVANTDNEHAKDVLAFPADRRVSFGFEEPHLDQIEHLGVSHKELLRDGGRFTMGGLEFTSPLLGDHNIANVVAAVAVGYTLGLSWEVMREGVRTLPGIPGRLEYIREGQSFDVVVDYAFEPKAMTSLYETLLPHLKGRLIHVFGATGGGRDVSRRSILGEMAGKRASVVVVTNEDPYDDDPYEIMEAVAKGITDVGKKRDQDFFMILDRRQAIAKALSLARAGDLVLITGKGSEQAIAGPKGRLLSWDDRRVARDELKKLIHA